MHCVANRSKTPLRKDVKFFQSDVFGYMHVKLHDRETLRRHFQRGIIGDGIFGNQDPARMHAALVRKLFEQLAVFMHQPHYFVFVMVAEGFCGQGI